MIGIPTYHAVNQSSEYKDAHYVFEVIHLSVFLIFCFCDRFSYSGGSRNSKRGVSGMHVVYGQQNNTQANVLF